MIKVQTKLVVYKPMGAEHAVDHTIAQQKYHRKCTIALRIILLVHVHRFAQSYRTLK